MRGGLVHNRVIAGRLERLLRLGGASVEREFPVEPGAHPRCLDLLATLGDVRLGIEIELTPRRVPADIKKAQLAGVPTLLIVTPTASSARAAKGALPRAKASTVDIVILPLGLAAQWVTNWCSLYSDAIFPPSENKG